MVKPKRGTPADIAAARRMREAKKSVDEIAKELGFHRTTITRWTKVKARRITQAEIADIRRMKRQRKSLRQIQKKHPYSLYTLSKYTNDIKESYSKTCQNPECGKQYETNSLKSMYCSKRCRTRHRYLKTRKKGR
jgi:predicted transcriptional regulator